MLSSYRVCTRNSWLCSVLKMISWSLMPGGSEMALFSRLNVRGKNLSRTD